LSERSRHLDREEGLAVLDRNVLRSRHVRLVHRARMLPAVTRGPRSRLERGACGLADVGGIPARHAEARRATLEERAHCLTSFRRLQRRLRCPSPASTCSSGTASNATGAGEAVNEHVPRRSLDAFTIAEKFQSITRRCFACQDLIQRGPLFCEEAAVRSRPVRRWSSVLRDRPNVGIRLSTFRWSSIPNLQPMGPGCSVRSANATTGGDGFGLHANVAVAANKSRRPRTARPLCTAGRRSRRTG
jgi:hypothetical protein